MKGSGKQVLLEIVRGLSTRKLLDDQLADATQQVRAGLLLHGSTAEESFEHMSHLGWVSREDEWGRKRQGIGSGSGVLLTEFLGQLLGAPNLEAHVRGALPSLSSREYLALEHALWCVVSALQMYEELNSVEMDVDDLDIEGWVANLTAKYEHHFGESE
jgi:hypothetical protein